MAVSGAPCPAQNLESVLNFSKLKFKPLPFVYEKKHPHEKHWRNGCNLQNNKKNLTVLIFIWIIATACNDSSRTRNLASIDSLQYELVDVKINDFFLEPQTSAMANKNC